MSRIKNVKLICGTSLLIMAILYIKWYFHYTYTREYMKSGATFKDFDNVNGLNSTIVPDIVHYIFFDSDGIDFVTYLSMISVLKIHKPKQIFMHSNIVVAYGDYWQEICDISVAVGTKIKTLRIEQPTHVYGQMLSSVFHATDLMRINVLKTWGGIYLDSDVLVLKPLHQFRRYEMALGWPENQYIGSQVLIAHKDARFLQYWLEGYQRYHPTDWYYNAGKYPTKYILEQRPHLVHRVKKLFGVHNLQKELYIDRHWNDWREYYTIHLLSRHFPAPTVLNKQIVQTLKCPFGKIAQTIISTHVVPIDLKSNNSAKK